MKRLPPSYIRLAAGPKPMLTPVQVAWCPGGRLRRADRLSLDVPGLRALTTGNGNERGRLRAPFCFSIRAACFTMGGDVVPE